MLSFKTNHQVVKSALTQPSNTPMRFIRKQFQKELKTTAMNPQLDIKFYSPRNSFKESDRNLATSKLSEVSSKIVRKPNSSRMVKTLNRIHHQYIQPQSQSRYQKTHTPNNFDCDHQSIQQQNSHLKNLLTDYQQQLKKYSNLKSITHQHNKNQNQPFLCKSCQNHANNSQILQKTQSNLLISQQTNKQLMQKINQLQTQNIELSEKYNKKNQEVKYQEIQLGTLRKKKHELVALQIKLLRLTEKNRLLQQKIQMLKKQSSKITINNKFKKRKNSSDSMFSLSSDHSEDSLQPKQAQFYKK